ncbi:MAG: ribosomal RNA small subunit methyltransferase [Planctomycetota bacterium]|nr:MAG: ribosomal RNA small subunit methyltransferase [Planctomycetota bacterium]
MALPDGRRLSLRVSEGIHPPDPYASAFAACFRVRPGDRAWDLGCGAGGYGCAAAALGASRVLMSDLDPAAVECAVENAGLNGLEGVSGRAGSLFAPARGERFDFIMTSVPQIPAPAPLNLIRYGGSDGLHFFRRIAAVAPAHLRPGGRLYALVTDWPDARRVAALLEAQRFRVRTIARVERPFQPVEYDRMSPGLFDYLDARARAGHGKYRRRGAWCYLGVSLLEATVR